MQVYRTSVNEDIERLEFAYREEFQSISDYLFNNPELGGEEFLSSQYIGDFMKKHGFEVSYPYDDIPTAFIAEFGDATGPTIAFLAEYDGLPGYDTPSGNGHACAHNWIAATMCGVAVVLSKLKSRYKGRIMLIGTPAEETYGAKVNMIKKNAFSEVDIIFQAHLENDTVVDSSALAMSSMRFEFTGRAAHAASYPEEGINALDAVQIMFMGVNSLRQHLRDDARVHGIITEGGVATNIVPDKGVCKISMRAKDRNYLKHVVSRVIDCARGAALITGAQVDYEKFENDFDDLVNVPSLMDMTVRNLKHVGIDRFLSKEDAPPPGSTDIGNVSYVCPTLYAEIAMGADRPFRVHEAEALSYANSEFAYKRMEQVIKAYAMTAVELFENPELVESVKEEHRRVTESIG